MEEVTTETRQLNPRSHPEKKIKYVDVSAVSNETLAIEGFAEYSGSDAPSRARKEILSEDVIFATVRPSLKRIAMVPQSLNGQLCSTAFCVVRANPDVADPSFLFYSISSDSFVNRVTTFQRGISYPAVTDRVVLSEKIRLPPLKDQRAIASILTKVRNSLGASREVLKSAKGLRRALLTSQFRRSESTVQPSAVEGATELGKLPSGWHVSTLEEVFDIQQGKALSPGARVGKSPRPFLRTANVLWGRVDTKTIDRMDFSEEEANLYALRKGDLLVCEGGDIGRTAIWTGEVDPCYYQNHLHRLRPKTDRTIALFYMYWMDAAINVYGLYIGQGNRTTIPNLSKGRLSSFAVPVPPTEDQVRIASQLTVVDEKIKAEEARLHHLQDLYQTLLHELLSGKRRLVGAAG